MIGKTSIKDATGVEVAISQTMADALSLWARLYANNPPWKVSDHWRSLNLPATIASKIALMATIEMAVEIEGSARAEFLKKQLDPVVDRMRAKIESACALGGMVFKPYVDGRRLLVDFVRADAFYPMAFNTAGEITSAIFADQRKVGDYWYTRLEYHNMTARGCEIQNLVFRSTSDSELGQAASLTDVSEWAGLLPFALITGISQPLFAYFKFPMENNVDPNSNLGVSCYSRAIDLIKDADEIYTNLVWEFKSGERAIYVDELALTKDSDGKPKLADKRLYRAIAGSGSEIGDGSKLFEGWTPEFREASIISGLDAVLKKIEFNCGLAYGTISDPNVEAKTATEIKISKQSTYATVTDTQKALRDALDILLYAMDAWATLANLAPRGTYAATYQFDDSVVTDKDLQMQQDRSTVGMNAMPLYMFLMRNYGLDEVTAKTWIAEAKAEMPEEDPFAGVGA